MRAKSPDRQLAENLRREQGLSYKEISALTGVNKSTLSGWLRNIPLSAHQEQRLQEHLYNNRATFAARAMPINRQRYQHARQQACQIGADTAATLPKLKCVDELALAMLYLGEGAKRNGTVQIANTDPAILKFVLWALTQLYQINEARLSLRVNLIEAARPVEEQMLQWWCRELGYPRTAFRKTQFDRRSRATTMTEEYHGVCTISYGDTYLQQRILSLAEAYLRACQAPALKPG
jgi:hypothetical protein